jgi:protease-4
MPLLFYFVMDDQRPPVYPSSQPFVAPPPPPRQGRGWKILALILMVILAMILARDFFRLLLALGGKAGGGRGRNLEEVVVEDNDARDKIAVVSVAGFISGALLDGRGRDMVSSISDQLRVAAADDTVKAVLLKVDSPGGEVMAADEIHRALVEFQKTSRKPVIASMGTLAASGGYYVSAPCRWIVANDLTLTGSIGVIMHGWNYRGLMDKVGVRPEVYKSGRFKDMLSGDKREQDILPEERQMAQVLIDQTYARFTNIVFTGRQEARKKNQDKGRALSPEWTNYVDGRVLTGQDAYNLGFVDEKGNFETAVERAKNIVHITNANLVRYERPFDLGNVLRWLVKTEPPAVKVDLGIDLPKLQAGCLYFLSPMNWH